MLADYALPLCRQGVVCKEVNIPLPVNNLNTLKLVYSDYLLLKSDYLQKM